MESTDNLLELSKKQCGKWEDKFHKQIQVTEKACKQIKEKEREIEELSLKVASSDQVLDNARYELKQQIEQMVHHKRTRELQFMRRSIQAWILKKMLWAQHDRLEEIRQMMSDEALEKLTEKEE